ncbi:MAG: class I SAM-dependent methyltransferase [Firmicutes bacterium HGW-Firmicutes-1]|jgi:ubiquinone/menaquinone biosynthesis C-methylase UbiE|nr:MAG: class I SAM-dependent methyltransferase [Firmicutes bacterium HGW-Firmicutes-1]
MQKINAEFVRHAFASKDSLREYSIAAMEIELWESEKIIFEKYFNKEDRILDIGCGTGRVTFGLHNFGYNSLIGVDVSKEMLKEAIRINNIRNATIEFRLGDATKLDLGDKIFDGAIFAYNGLMQIPWLENRMKAFKEINRILKLGAIFIFTTHDLKTKDVNVQRYWKEEMELWSKGKQDPRLPEFGDLLYKSFDRQMYMHVPSREEIVNCLSATGFEIVEDLYRPEIIEESEEVQCFSDDCRFWIVRKTIDVSL